MQSLLEISKMETGLIQMNKKKLPLMDTCLLYTSTPQEKATYSKIKEYVKEKYGVNVHTSYIAQVKRMCGLDMGNL